MVAYYNEIEPYVVQWLKNLIDKGLIVPGDVDDRSIKDVKPDDLKGYTQCHFFAGLGGWSHALRLAMWPDDRPVWTGSCPCQPFSSAGKGKASSDERHLWPDWMALIKECKPSRVFGEQVDAAIGWGWLDAVFNDLEEEGYACGATVLPACSIGAPHRRNRLWFVADADDHGQRRQSQNNSEEEGPRLRPGIARHDATVSELGNTNSLRRQKPHLFQQGRFSPRGSGANSEWSTSPWQDLAWLPCTDGKQRPTKPGLQPLAHGVSARVGKLRAAGNAIVPQVASEFIEASL